MKNLPLQCKDVESPSGQIQVEAPVKQIVALPFIADVVVVIVPESGDSVQTMKAGLMEIADIFCVNKSDRPGSERIAAELQQVDLRPALGVGLKAWQEVGTLRRELCC